MILLITASCCIAFVGRIKTILNNQETCISNGGKTTIYFKLERGARQGDPISAHLFILVLEIYFIFVKNNSKVKGLNIFKHEFYTPLMQMTLLSFSKIEILNTVLFAMAMKWVV